MYLTLDRPFWTEDFSQLADPTRIGKEEDDFLLLKTIDYDMFWEVRKSVCHPRHKSQLIPVVVSELHKVQAFRRRALARLSDLLT